MSKMKSSDLIPLTAKTPERNLNAHKSVVVKAISNGESSLITVEGEVNHKS